MKLSPEEQKIADDYLKSQGREPLSLDELDDIAGGADGGLTPIDLLDEFHAFYRDSL